MAVKANGTITAESAGDFDQAALQALGVPYEVDNDFAVAKIDVPASRQVWEQVRPGEPLDEENIDQLRAVVENGGTLPAPIVYRDNRGKWRVISGNHRTEMYRRNGTTKIRAYVATGLEGLKFENGAVLALAFESNAGHGKQVAEADRLKQALDLVHKGGYDLRSAARALSVPEGKLRDEKEKVESTQRLERLGVNTEPIPVTARRRIASIKSDRLAKRLGQLVPMMDQKVATVEEAVKTINASRSDAAGARVLDGLDKTLRAASGGSSSDGKGTQAKRAAVSPVLTNLNRVLTSIANVSVDEVKTAGTTAEYRVVTLEKVRVATKRLNEIKTAL